jgi:hypothetical protein
MARPRKRQHAPRNVRRGRPAAARALPDAASFTGTSRPLTGAGLAAAADRLAVGAEEIWTVIRVETGGSGFLADRRPQILFERHVFHRLTGGRFDDHGEVSDPNPGGYGALGAHQYDRLSVAIALDRTAALQSASWGLAQILGVNFSDAGFASVDSMVQQMIDGEDAQLASMSAFITTNRLDRALKIHDWATFARGYNGPAYAASHYDLRLRGEFQKLSAGVLPDLDVRAAQSFLTFRGYDPGPIDGLLGPLTRSAIAEFQHANGLAETGTVDPALLAALDVQNVP